MDPKVRMEQIEELFGSRGMVRVTLRQVHLFHFEQLNLKLKLKWYNVNR